MSISHTLSLAYLSASGAVDNHWIGLNDMSREGGFIWSDGSAVAYVNWDDGEPNNSGEEDCGLILAGKGGVWNDAKCLAVGGSDLGFKSGPNYLVPPRRTWKGGGWELVVACRGFVGGLLAPWLGGWVENLVFP